MKKSKNIDYTYPYGFSVESSPVFLLKKGLSEKVVEKISQMKKEPLFMKLFRKQAYALFCKMPMPKWGGDLSKLNLEDLTYYSSPVEKQMRSWKDLPKEIKDTYDRIGVPQAEKNFLAGVAAQFDSEIVYESIKAELDKKGVIFCDMESAVKKYPKIIKEHLGKLVPAHDNKFAALNSAVWSGGSFIYIPKGVHVNLPLQAYFRINASSFGQFERTLIIADEDSYVHYIEGCTAPVYTKSSLHAAVVEIYVKPRARVRYTTVQNWSNNVYNLVTKRAKAEKGAVMEWVDCNIGSKLTMKYPAIILDGRGARGEVYSIAYAKKFQHQDAGAKVIHLAANTHSRILSKSISTKGGRTSFRGLISISKKAVNSSVYSSCDALILDDISRSDTYPKINIRNNSSKAEHEAKVQKIGEDTLFYIMSRGISETDAQGLLVNGFIAPITKEIPLEYSIELNRLLNIEMSNSVG